MDQQTLHDHFKRLKEAVLVKRPILKEILSKHGTQKLFDYARDYINVNLNPPIQKRQDDFISTFKEEVEKRLGSKIAEGAARQLADHYFVSTADHHGPITHPFFVNSNLLTVAPCFNEKHPHLKYVIVLACSNISIDNSSFPRGLLFHSFAKNQLSQQRLAFFSTHVRPSVVYSLPPFTQKEVDKLKHETTHKQKKGEISTYVSDKVNGVLENIYSQPEVLNALSYSEQVTKTNLELWKRFFEPNHISPPDLVYIELESLVVQLLMKYHLSTDTTINHMIFNHEYEPLLNTYFDGIYGAFSHSDKSGTYLFWGLPKGGRYRMSMWKKDNFLVSQDGSFSVELTPDAIRKALENKELIPGLKLCFAIVAFYYGVKCLGGFNQVNYLTYMKNAYIKMQVDRGNYRSIEVCARSQTKELCDGLTLAFLQDPTGKMVLATGLDLILYGSDATWDRFIDVLKNITFEEALNPLLPEIYKITYLEHEWDAHLATLKDEDIIKITGIDKKIKPCAYITAKNSA